MFGALRTICKPVGPIYYAVRGMSYAHLNVYWVEERIDISQNPDPRSFRS